MADPLLRQEYDKAAANSSQKLHASLALLPVDPAGPYLFDRLLDAQPHEVPVIREALAAHKDELLDKLWAEAEEEKGQEPSTAGGGGPGAVRPGERQLGQGARSRWQRSGD